MSETPSISVEQRPEAVVIHVLASQLDEKHVGALRTGVTEAQAAGSSLPFIIDMAGVSFVPSLTLGVIVRLANEFRSKHQRLIFVSLQPPVRQLLAITKLNRMMEITDDVAAALRSLGASA
jgi:anti-anti-sigma factor